MRLPRPFVSSLALVGATGYLVGSIPIADVVARRHGSPDLREVGDRNPGYWNARQTLGHRAARPILVGDVSKGALAAGFGAAVGSATHGPWWTASLGGGAAMVGHAFPVWSGGRGGRSVLAFVGTSLVAAPVASGVALAVFAATWATTGRLDRAARFGVAALPAIQLIVDGPRRTAATGVLMTFVGLRFLSATAGAAATGGHATTGSDRTDR